MENSANRMFDIHESEADKVVEMLEIYEKFTPTTQVKVLKWLVQRFNMIADGVLSTGKAVSYGRDIIKET